MKTSAARRPEILLPIVVIATALLSPFLFRLVAWLFLNLPVRERTRIAEFILRRRCVSLAFGWMLIIAG